MKWSTVVLSWLVFVPGCVGAPQSTTPSVASTQAVQSPTIRITLVGDVMLGRGIATAIERDGDDVFASVRHLLADADIAAANLESPLTTSAPVRSGDNVLVADPAAAVVLAGAGFDLVSLPNNHAGDAGPDGVVDTLEAIRAAGMTTVGAGSDSVGAAEPVRLAVGDLRIGFLAFDATGVGLVAGSAPGVMAWDPVTSADTISVLANDADLTIVSVHGGAEYLPVNDPQMVEIAEAAAAAGADVVWGHGAHVIQPVMTLVGDRPTVAATSLGNFLFDQAGPDRTTGAALELLADRDGIIAYRVAITRHPDRRVEFVEWQAPEGPAGWLDDAWWSVIRPLQPAPTTATLVSTFPHGDLIAAARGDITGDGSVDVVASFRRPHKVTPFSSLHPEIRWQDRLGRSAHVGVYDPDDLDEVWVAGTVLMPVSAIEACDRSIAIVHNSLDDSTPIATSAWAWNGFGFDTGPELAGPGQPRCADLDGDGLTEPLILRDQSAG